MTKAAEGFARGQGISAADLIKEGEYTWAQVVNKGKWWKKYCPLFHFSYHRAQFHEKHALGR